jgi:hypothetical protein
VAFAFLMPFFFSKCGFKRLPGAMFANLGVLGLLFAARMLPKLGFVSRSRRHIPRHATFATLPMGTGSPSGRSPRSSRSTPGIIDGIQFSLLFTVVVASALIPTAIAQTFFHPIADLERRGRPIPAEEYL